MSNEKPKPKSPQRPPAKKGGSKFKSTKPPYKKPDVKKPFNKFNNSDSEENQFFRVRMPRNNEVIGIIDQRVGGSRMKVRCMDGKVRLCRIPGRLKRKLWTREGDILIIEPWEFGGDEKGDVVYKYKPNHIPILKKKGVLDLDEEYEEF